MSVYRVHVAFCVAGLRGLEALNVEASDREWAKHEAVSALANLLWRYFHIGELNSLEVVTTTYDVTSCVLFSPLPAASRAIYLH